jgi:hypothetical protein
MIPQTGAVGAFMRGIPGTGAYDLEKTIDTIKANIGFAELSDMRQMSPTGGALGQVAVQELSMLQAVLSSLDANQSKQQVLSSLEQVKKHYTNWLEVMKRQESLEAGGGEPTPKPAPKPAPKAGANPARKPSVSNW